MIHSVETASSIWKFNTDMKHFVRFPKNETLEDHKWLPHSRTGMAQWTEYEKIENDQYMGYDRIKITLPSGYHFWTGALNEDQLLPEMEDSDAG